MILPSVTGFDLPIGVGRRRNRAMLARRRPVRRALFKQLNADTYPSWLDPFNRGSGATEIGPDGLIRYAPENRLPYSTPDVGNFSRVRMDFGGSVWHGDVELVFIVEDSTASNSHYFYKDSIPCQAGQKYTVSFYTKAGSRSVAIQFDGTGGIFTYDAVLFDPATGTVGWTDPDCTASIEDVGGGVYRCIATRTALATGNGRVNCNLSNGHSAFANTVYTGDGVSGAYIGGVQFEAGGVARTLHKTTGTPWYGPAFDHDPVTLAPLGVQAWGLSTNLCTHFVPDSTNWVFGSATFTANVATSPMGGLDAGRFIEQGGTGTKYLSGPAVSFTSGTSYTMAVFAKKAVADDIIQITFPLAAFGGSQYANFNLSTGTITTVAGGTAKIRAYKDGWYRLFFTATATTTASGSAGCVLTDNNTSLGRTPAYTGDNTNGFYVWGMVVGTAEMPGIPTYGATATRNADSHLCSGTNFSDWFNPAEGTIVIEGIAGATTSYPLEISDGTTANRYFVNVTSAGNVSVFSSGGSNTGTLATVAIGSTYRVAFRYSSAGVAASCNGSAVASFAKTLQTVDRMRIGANVGGTLFSNSTVQEVSAYRRALPNTQLVALSTP